MTNIVPRRSLDRPPGVLLFVLVAVWLTACAAPERGPSPPETAAPPESARASDPDEATRPQRRIVFLGDSVTAGFGLAESDAFPALVERALRDEGRAVVVLNAGVSGDTSAGGVSRLDWVLSGRPDLLVLELGGNDALRGQSLANTESNLREIVTRTREAGTRVLLLGMDVPVNYGTDYSRRFAEIYPKIAAELSVALLPGFVQDVGFDPSLMQPDGLHPTAEGHRVLADALLPPLREMLDAIGSGD